MKNELICLAWVLTTLGIFFTCVALFVSSLVVLVEWNYFFKELGAYYARFVLFVTFFVIWCEAIRYGMKGFDWIDSKYSEILKRNYNETV